MVMDGNGMVMDGNGMVMDGNGVVMVLTLRGSPFGKTLLWNLKLNVGA